MIIEKHDHARGIMRLLAFFVIVLGGCKSMSWNRSVPKLTFTSPTTGNKVEASGNAAEPAKVETEKRQTEIPLPPNSQVSFVETSADPKLNRDAQTETRVLVPTQTVFRQTVTRDSVVQAKAFQPPSPPSPVEIAKGESIKWYFVAGAILAVLGIVFAYLQHYKAAGFAFVGGFAVPALGTLVASNLAIHAAIAFVAVSLTLFVAWYLVKNHPEIKTEALSELQSLKLEYEKLKTQNPKI